MHHLIGENPGGSMEDGQNTKNIIRNYHEEWAIMKPNEGRFKPKS
jgi:hypothetical protein